MTTLEIICLYGLGISLCLLLFDAAGKTLRAAWRRNGRRYGVAASLIGLAVVCTINAQKPNPPVITVDSFLADAGSYATNDVLHVAVTNAPAYAGIDFSSCPVLVYARPRGLSDAPEWEELLPRRTFSELPADYAIEDATNYNYLVYLDYVPPSPVHTNGVFELRGFVVPSAASGTRSAAFATSSAKRDIPYDVEVEYLEIGTTGTWKTYTGCSIPTTGVFEILVDVTLNGGYGSVNALVSQYRSGGYGFVLGIRNGCPDLYLNRANTINHFISEGRHIFRLFSNGTENWTLMYDDLSRIIDRGNAWYNAPGTIALFNASDRFNEPTYAGTRFHAIQFIFDDTIVRDFIPVRVGKVGYMYDRVSGQLFGNQGTGAFIVGPDIKE